MSSSEATRAVAIMRSSQGESDKVSLKQQRAQVRELADDLADEVDVIDLAIHTGFSIFERDRDDDRLDANPRMERLIFELLAGEYDYVCGWDDTRMARDDFFFVLQWAALIGGAEFRFVEEIDTNSLEFRISRVVEQFVKVREIKKSQSALEYRREQGFYEGAPPKGLAYDAAGEHLVVGDKDVFETACEAIRMRASGESYRSIAAETGLSVGGGMKRLFENWEMYDEHAGESLPDPTTV